MKKVVMMFALASLIVSFVACGGQKAESGDVLAKYETFVDKVIASGLIEKAARGDMAATQEWTKLMSDFAITLGPEIQSEIEKFTPEQSRKYEEISWKWADYAENASG